MSKGIGLPRLHCGQPEKTYKKGTVLNRLERVEYTRTELLAQPEVIRETLDREGETIARLACAFEHRGLQNVQVIGNGDSFCVAEAIVAPWRAWLNIPVLAIQALEHAYERVDAQTLLIVISAMGGAGATVTAARRGQDQGAFVLGVTNAPSSDLVTQTSAILPIHATRIGWPTQSTTAPIAALLALGIAWAERRNLSLNLSAIKESLRFLPNVMTEVLRAQDAPMRSLAEQWQGHTTFFLAGSGPAYTAARLGASKIKEISQDHAYAMYLEEYHHYYSVKTGEAFFLLAPPGSAFDREVQTAESAYSVGADVRILQDATSDAVCKAYPRIDLPPTAEELTSIVYALPLHLFAQHLGIVKQQPEWALQDHAGRPM